MTKTEKIIYLAGLFDGEGSFSIQVRRDARHKQRYYVNFTPRMLLKLRYGHEEPLALLQEIFGGEIYYHKKSKCHQWCISKRSIVNEAAMQLLPYLKIKRKVCELFLEALALFPVFNRKGTNLYGGQRIWSKETALRVAEIALTMNPASNLKLKKKIARLKSIKRDYKKLDS